ncbi:hypothetical protein L6164_008492 [Bauhinia variegata]|uniref:Uncharacterized protein n=1 Tax=Bauhinia variegata TaxID=167791 RepID=A0ACB9PH64_BAUVA|nr:hypothetical protein L6164_008492 [Bauhinia variegata]
MKKYGDNLEDIRVVEKIIHTLASKFEVVAVSIEQSQNLEVITIDELQGSLQAYEERLKKETIIQTLQAKVSLNDKEKETTRSHGRGRFRGCGHGRERGYLDTGASNHMMGNKELFVDLDEMHKEEIIFGNDLKVPIEGKCDVLVLTKNGGHKLISQVYFIPSLKVYILNMGQLLENGYDIHLKDTSCTLKDESHNLIARVPMSKNRLFLLNLKVDHPKCLIAFVKDSSWL